MDSLNNWMHKFSKSDKTVFGFCINQYSKSHPMLSEDNNDKSVENAEITIPAMQYILQFIVFLLDCFIINLINLK